MKLSIKLSGFISVVVLASGIKTAVAGCSVNECRFAPLTACITDTTGLNYQALVFKRYAATDKNLVLAWKILIAAGFTAVTGTFVNPDKMSLLHAEFSPDRGKALQTSSQYRILLPALDLFNRCIPALKTNSQFVTDLNSLTAEVLNRYLNQLELKAAHALAEKEKNGFKKYSTAFLKTSADFNLLILNDSAFNNGNQVSIKAARKQWVLLFNYATTCLLTHQKFNPKLIMARSDLSNTHYLPQANTISLSLIVKQCQLIYERYNNTETGFE